MKSDTDFANPYEKELDAQESKIKELEAKLKEAINGTLLKRYNEEKEDALEKLKIAVEALEKYQKAKVFTSATANLALAAIKETDS
jgi:DNA polymerase sigma